MHGIHAPYLYDLVHTCADSRCSRNYARTLESDMTED